MEMEFKRNEQRYRFLKWGTQAFNGFRVVPPGIGIVHQVNLEYLAKGVFEKDGVYYPDTLVGTDSHTTMINGFGIVGWGVGGIEAEAGMLGQPVYILTPDVVGVHLSGDLPQGATATDLVLRVTEILREAKVVGKFVEFFGEGAAKLPATDRATIANMAPEYGATMGFFGADEKTLDYFRATGRSDEQIETIKNYYTAQNLFGIPRKGEVDYTNVIELNLETIQPAVAGPKRPQDRINLTDLDEKFEELFVKPVAEGGFGKTNEQLEERHFVTIGAKVAGVARAAERKIRLRFRFRSSTIQTRKTRTPGRKPKWSTIVRHPTAWKHENADKEAARDDHRQRRCFDRGDHFLHEHIESDRDARRRNSGEKSGGKRNENSRLCQNFARAGFARRDGIFK